MKNESKERTEIGSLYDDVDECYQKWSGGSSGGSSFNYKKITPRNIEFMGKYTQLNNYLEKLNYIENLEYSAWQDPIKLEKRIIKGILALKKMQLTENSQDCYYKHDPEPGSHFETVWKEIYPLYKHLTDHIRRVFIACDKEIPKHEDFSLNDICNRTPHDPEYANSVRKILDYLYKIIAKENEIPDLEGEHTDSISGIKNYAAYLAKDAKEYLQILTPFLTKATHA